LCSAGVLAATIIATSEHQEILESLLEADNEGKVETLAIILKLKPELLIHNERISSILTGTSLFTHQNNIFKFFL